MLEHSDITKCDPATLFWQNQIAKSEEAFAANLALLDLPQGRLSAQENVNALRNVGVYHLLVSCDYVQAIIFLKMAAQIIETALGLQHADLVDIYGQIAGALKKTGKRHEAIAYRFRKLELITKLRGADSSSVKTLLRELAQEAAESNYHEMELSLRFRSLRLTAKERDPYEIGIALERIGCLKCTIGDAESGVRFYKAAFALYRKALGDTDVWVLWCMGKLAAAYCEAGNLFMAMVTYARAHELLEGCLFEIVADQLSEVVHDYEDCLVFVLESYGRLLIKNGHPKDGDALLQKAVTYRLAR